MTVSTQRRTKRQQRVEELCVASLRAATGIADLHYREGHLHHGGRRLPIHAPHVRVDTEEDEFTDCRGATDAIALRMLYSNPAIHGEFCPDNGDAIERLMFEWLEQLRVETLVRDDMPGMRHNLQLRFENWSRNFYRSGLTKGALGMLLYAAAQMCWSRLTAYPVLPETEDYIESTRFELSTEIGKPLAGMRRYRNNQRLFAPYALEVARLIGRMVKSERSAAGLGTADEAPDNDATAPASHFALLVDFEAGEGEMPAQAASGESKVFADSKQGYRVYTTSYDTEIMARSLVRKPLLREYREKLDQLVAVQGVNIPRLARLLRAMLAEQANDGWLFGEEDGVVDGRRLAQIISSPAECRVFRRDRFVPVSRSLVSLLVDCSGSMKAHIEGVATLIDILLRALEMAGVSSEVLGFSTGTWNGGRAWQDWHKAGEPLNPGRLNEVCHMVFKSAEHGWRRSRPGIAALLKPDLFREGIDGEAVEWACDRMLARDEIRRILIVISDGCPSDAATGRANDAFYLDNHLKEVIVRREREGTVEIMGLGVGLDLSPFYQNSLATDMTQALDNALFADIVKLIGRCHRR